MTPSNVSMTWPQYLRRQCVYKGKLYKLTKMEIEVILVLLLNHPRPVNRDALIEALYCFDDREPDYGYNCVNQFIARIKKKIDRDVIVSRPYVGFTLSS